MFSAELRVLSLKSFDSRRNVCNIIPVFPDQIQKRLFSNSSIVKIIFVLAVLSSLIEYASLELSHLIKFLCFAVKMLNMEIY